MSSREQTLERVVGIFLLASLAGLFALSGFAAIGSDLFTRRSAYRLELEHGAGLTAGTDVLIAGMRVGHVSEVSLTPQRTVQLWLTVEDQYANHVRTDSVGRVTMTLSGKAVIIEAGDGEVLQPGKALVSGKHFDVLMALEKMDLVGTLEKIQRILEDLTVLAGEMELGEGRLPEVIDSVLLIIQDLHQGKGALGRLLKDDSIVDQLGATLSSASDAADKVQSAAVSLEQTSGELARAAGSVEEGVGHIGSASESLGQTARDVGGAAGELRTTMGNLNIALQDLSVTLEAIQGLPLVRGQMKKKDQDPE